MLLSWLLSDTWLMSVPARVVDVLLMTVTLWLASRWCCSKQQAFGKALLVSSLNGVLGIGLYALFVWVRDTGALPWRGPLWLVEMFLVAQTVLFAVLILVAYRRDRWRSINVALVALTLTGIIEAGLILLLSVLAPHTSGLQR
ncbi:MAG: hypothetical protein C0398_07635 [Coprothermobacter sp.]|jgi:hypothetical protein|nr:hypothetical protein [Coprothermobacter sp.]